MSDDGNKTPAESETIELEAVRRVLEASALSPHSAKGRYPVTEIEQPADASRAHPVAEAGHTRRRGSLTEDERDELRKLLAGPERDASPTEIPRHDLTTRYERLATLTRPSTQRALLFALDRDADRELLITRLDPKLAHEAQAEGRLHALARKLERFGHKAVSVPKLLGAADDAAPLVGWDLPDGASLGSEIARRGALRPPHALAIAHHIVSTLESAHRAHLVHGALDLENVWLLESVPWTESNPHGVGIELVEFGFGTWNGDGKTPRQADDLADAMRLFYALLVGAPAEPHQVHASALSGLPENWRKLFERSSDPARGFGDASSLLVELNALAKRDRLVGATSDKRDPWMVAAGALFLTTVGAVAWKLGSDHGQPNMVQAGESQPTAEHLRLEGQLAAKRDEVARIRTELSTNESAREALVAQVKALEDELLDLRNGREDAQAALVERDRKHDELERERLSAQSERETHAQEVQELEANYQRVVEERERLLTNLEAAVREAGLVDVAHREALADRDRVLDTLRTEATELGRRESELAAKLADTEALLATQRAQTEREAAARAKAVERTTEVQRELETTRTRVEEAASTNDQLSKRVQALEEAATEAARQRTTENAHHRATIDVLDARIRSLLNRTKEAKEKRLELEAKIEELEAERDGLQERLAEELERRIVRATPALHTPARPTAYATLVADFHPARATVDEEELDRLRALLEATTIENAALSRALAESGQEAAADDGDLRQRITELERELAAAKSQQETGDEFSELEDLRRSRDDAQRRLTLIQNELEASRAEAAALSGELAGRQQQLEQSEAQLMRERAEAATRQATERLVKADREERTQADEANSERVQTLIRTNESTSQELATTRETLERERAAYEQRLADLRSERNDLSATLERARQRPSRERDLVRRLRALESERESLEASIAEERVSLRRRLEASANQRIDDEVRQIADELARERARTRALADELDAVRRELEAERAGRQKDSSESNAALQLRDEQLESLRGELVDREATLDVTTTERDRLAGELEAESKRADEALERIRETIGETIALRGRETELTGDLDDTLDQLQRREARLTELVADRTRRLDHSATARTAGLVDELLTALEANDARGLAASRRALGDSRWSDPATNELAEGLVALNQRLAKASAIEASASADQQIEGWLDSIGLDASALLRAETGWQQLARETPWLFEPDADGEPTDRPARMEAWLDEARAELARIDLERNDELRLAWSRRESELDARYETTRRLASYVGASLERMSHGLATKATELAGRDARIDVEGLGELPHLTDWARGLAATRPFDQASRELNLLAFARSLEAGSVLGAAPSPLPLPESTRPDWWKRALELARGIEDPAPAFAAGSRSTWSRDGDEFELVVERRRTDVNDARVVLEVRLDGARESWRLEDRRWLRLDDAGALLGEIDLGQLRTRARWSDPGGSSWAVFEGASGRLAPRIGPVAWREESGASIELVRLGSDRNRDSEPLAAR